ncbi:hypothetical protein BRC78_00645 [Halobacteriales archaeon QH_8_68_33]|nr:MAG: hypothetical protein BRC78_00645 [Halobacteriales archaeon QH_8_68_33]
MYGRLPTGFHPGGRPGRYEQRRRPDGRDDARFQEAREWSRYVGIVDNDTDAVDAFGESHGVRPDFDQGEADKWLAMEEIRGTTDTPRHVFVGTSVEDRRIADHLGWEYRDPETVAEKADWDLANEEEPEGLVDRLLGLVRGE